MIIAQALKFAAARLNAGLVDLPSLEAEILLSAVLKKPREFSLTHGEKKLSQSQFSQYQRLLKKRLKGEPAAYLTGHKEFYGLDFIVNKNVLIPRPETELMVEEALKLIAHNSSGFTRSGVARQPVTLVDIGTGSGCIIITLTKILNHELRIMNYESWGIDISKKALTVARSNAQTHGVNKNIKFLQGNLIDTLIHNSSFMIHNSLIILANLPYGWPAWKNNCSMNTLGLKFEPEIALFTDKKGLGLYEKLFKQIKELRVMSCGLRNISILCEFDPRQTAKIKQLIKQELPKARFQIKKDLSSLNRLAIIYLSPSL